MTVTQFVRNSSHFIAADLTALHMYAILVKTERFAQRNVRCIQHIRLTPKAVNVYPIQEERCIRQMKDIPIK